MIRGLHISTPILADNGQLVANTFACFNSAPIYLTIDEQNDFDIKCPLKFYRSIESMNNGDFPVFSTLVHAHIPVNLASQRNFYDMLYLSFNEGQFFNLEILYN